MSNCGSPCRRQRARFVSDLLPVSAKGAPGTAAGLHNHVPVALQQRLDNQRLCNSQGTSTLQQPRNLQQLRQQAGRTREPGVMAADCRQLSRVWHVALVVEVSRVPLCNVVTAGSGTRRSDIALAGRPSPCICSLQSRPAIYQVNREIWQSKHSALDTTGATCSSDTVSVTVTGLGL